MKPATPRWRPMAPGDIPPALELAGIVHPGLPEDETIFAERLRLFPAGCLVLDDRGEVAGYALSHPIRRFEPPPLDTLIGAIVADADDYYLHDVVVAPRLRGAGLANSGVAALLRMAAPFASASLVSVYGTAPFWSRFGFRQAEGRDMARKLAPYGPDAVYMVRPTPKRGA